MIAVALLKVLPTAVAGLFPGVLALVTVGAMVIGRVGPVPLKAVGAALGALGNWGRTRVVYRQSIMVAD